MGLGKDPYWGQRTGFGKFEAFYNQLRQLEEDVDLD